ncbi:hypothetical protein ABZ630_11240, partial [Streptomyces albidoflavus]|uniref:hypothetical protein n=1 Tax=Streptomyces albidoflavus TaxID=1886 RepID=UPI0033C72DA3
WRRGGRSGRRARSARRRGCRGGRSGRCRRVRLADLGKVAGIGLGISVVATALPGIGVLRLHPRSILASGE